MANYTIQGPARGSCGHKHKTIRTALMCGSRDNRRCTAAGGYSDRIVVRCDGELRILHTEVQR